MNFFDRMKPETRARLVALFEQGSKPMCEFYQILECEMRESLSDTPQNQQLLATIQVIQNSFAGGFEALLAPFVGDELLGQVAELTAEYRPAPEFPDTIEG